MFSSRAPKWVYADGPFRLPSGSGGRGIRDEGASNRGGIAKWLLYKRDQNHLGARKRLLEDADRFGKPAITGIVAPKVFFKIAILGFEAGRSGARGCWLWAYTKRMAKVPRMFPMERFFITAPGLVMAVVSGISSLLFYVSKAPSIRPLLLIGVGLIASICVYVAWLKYVCRLRAFLNTNRGCVCLTCGYPLASLPPEGQCPECGQPYAHSTTAAIWQMSWVGKR